jgi:heat shock protein HspQ
MGAQPVDEGAALAKGIALAKHPLASRVDFPTLSLVIGKSVVLPTSSGAALPGIKAPSIAHARFAIGDVVRHRLFEFRGVIFDVDPVFANSEEWYEAIPEDIRPDKEQPFYHLFAENAESSYIAYVSQHNLVRDDSEEMIDHPAIDGLFDSYADGRYRLRREHRH